MCFCGISISRNVHIMILYSLELCSYVANWLRISCTYMFWCTWISRLIVVQIFRAHEHVKVFKVYTYCIMWCTHIVLSTCIVRWLYPRVQHVIDAHLYTANHSGVCIHGLKLINPNSSTCTLQTIDRQWFKFGICRQMNTTFNHQAVTKWENLNNFRKIKPNRNL